MKIAAVAFAILNLSFLGWAVLGQSTKTVEVLWDTPQEVISGYTVLVGTSSKHYDQEYETTANSKVLSLLKTNSYYVAVSSYNSLWDGPPSQEIIIPRDLKEEDLKLKISKTNNSVKIEFNTTAGRKYDLQYTTDFQNWNVLTTVSNAVDSVSYYTDPMTSIRFYRLAIW